MKNKYTIRAHKNTNLGVQTVTANTHGDFVIATNEALGSNSLAGARALFKRTDFNCLVGTIDLRPFIEGPLGGIHSLHG